MNIIILTSYNSIDIHVGFVAAQVSVCEGDECAGTRILHGYGEWSKRRKIYRKLNVYSGLLPNDCNNIMFCCIQNHWRGLIWLHSTSPKLMKFTKVGDSTKYFIFSQYMVFTGCLDWESQHNSCTSGGWCMLCVASMTRLYQIKLLYHLLNKLFKIVYKEYTLHKWIHIIITYIL